MSATIRPRLLRRASALVTAACSVAALSGCLVDTHAATLGEAHPGPYTIAISNGYTGNTWRTQFIGNLQNRANELKDQGILKDFTLVSAGTDINRQLSQIDQIVLDKPDAVLIAPTSGAAAEVAAEKFKAAGIVPFVINDPAPTKSAINIVPDNAAWYAAQTQWLVDGLGGKGEIVQVTGLPGNPSDTARQKAATDILAKFPGIKTVATVPGYWDQGKARQAMSTVLSSHSNISGVLEQDIMGLGVIQAFESAGVPLPKYMIGDYTKGFLEKWQSLPALETMAVPYSPTDGSDALNIIVKILAGGKIKPGVLQPNSIDSSILDNTIFLPPSLAITRDGKKGTWTPPGMDVISLDEALNRVDGKPDTFAVEAPVSEEQINAYFQ
ncbi:MAG: substrate-binding domain-containing protein [Mycobacterium sp.]